ncbi:DUF411 domain-containing protein [Pistricoccus aurantiacus]|uniref:DUF411 domain-containing protein n=1 Tax=Pistricoccus aurantiacus TaxID=1883414 RepID=UPI0036414CC0
MKTSLFCSTLLGLALSLAGTAVWAAPTVEMWKDPNCGCCTAWAEHMEANGFEVIQHKTRQMADVKRKQGVHSQLTSCHTATVGEHVIEGHVPASDVKRLLESDAAPAVLAVPGMPHGSPGMETGRVDEYAVYLWRDGEKPQVFSQYPQ